MRFFTLISRDNPAAQIGLFLVISLGLLSLYASWNTQHWTKRQEFRFANGNLADRVQLLFENGNISPAISHQLYRRGISTRPNYVVVGQDGWMYLGDRYEQVASRAARGVPELDEPFLHRWSTQLRQRQDWLESKGIRSLFAIAPNKHAIYPEHGPAWMPFADHGVPARLTAAARAAGVNIVDTGPAIRALKSEREWLYNRTDTHWTYPAAFSGYRSIMDGLGEDIVALSEGQVEFTPERQVAAGLARLLGFDGLYDDPFDPGYAAAVRRPVDGFCITRVTREFETTGPCKTAVDAGVLTSYLHAVELRNEHALNPLSVLLVEDSFGYAPSRFFQHSFRTVWHAHLGYILEGERLKQFVERFQPDVVIYMVVERNLLRPLAYEFDGASGQVEAPLE